MDDQKWHVMTEMTPSLSGSLILSHALVDASIDGLVNGDCLQELFDRHSCCALGNPEAPKFNNMEQCI